MRTLSWTPSALIVFALMTASCAGSRPTYAVAPPRLALPPLATSACVLPRLPDNPTQADLETAYARRGAAIATCDAARRLAVETLMSERRLLDAWRTADPSARQE